MKIGPKNFWIQTPTELSPFGTKILADGKELDRVRSVTFHQEAGLLPQLTIETFAVETIIQGTAEVEHITLCPACKKRLEQEPREIGAHDVTDLDDQWMRYVAGPKEPAD